MAKREKEYHKLPGRGIRSQGSWLAAVRTSATLWLGKDHVLSIDSMGGYAEDYKRFYFRDIQAIAIRKSVQGKIQSLVLGFLAGLCGIFALLITDPYWRGFWLVLGGLFLFFLLLNSLRGPTCVCHVRTAVQTEQLPSLNRLRTARKVMNVLKPLIEQAQGAVVREELPGRMQELFTRLPAAGAVTAAPARMPSSSPAVGAVLSAYDGRTHAVLFGLLLADAVRLSVDFFLNHLLITAIEILLWASIAIGLIMALAKQPRSRLPEGIQRLTWGVFAYVLAGFVIGLVHYVAISVQQGNSREVMTEWDILRVYSAMSPFDSVWLMGTMMFSLICSLVLGLVGILMLRSFRRIIRVPPPLAPVPGEPTANPN